MTRTLSAILFGAAIAGNRSAPSNARVITASPC